MKGWRIISILAVLVLTACNEDDLQVNNLNNGKILACGHGGAGFQSYTNPYPTNSLSSIRRAIEGLGADGVEIDVQMSADKKLFLYHNDELESLTDCMGCIPGMSSADILPCRYNRDFGVSQLSDEKVVLLETVLSKYATYAKRPVMYLDLREHNECDPSAAPNADTLVTEVVKIIHKYDGKSWIYVISGSADLLRKIARHDAGIKIYLDGPASAIDDAVKNGFDGICTNNDNITEAQVSAAHAKGAEVILFNVKTREGTLEAIRKSPDAIQSDNLDLLMEILRD
jgi:glycerophosphoryl diester phosphodiesterase